MGALRNSGTIAAIATAQGPGAVGIIRVSGAQARALALALFRSSRPGFAGLKPYRLHHGALVDAQGRVLDEALLAFMPGPGSFTGEDVVEFNCHGGPAVLRAVLDELLARGARLAAPGEFSFRAFKNGKLDLAQAEAIAETIAAPTRAALHLAQLKLSGALSRRIGELRARLEALRAQLCLAVDFPDEEVECLPLALLRGEALAVAQDMAGLLAGVERARAWREGVLSVLAGRVNAGKSSLLNALVGRNRALVSAQPGTTRDYLEEQLELEGLLVRLVDTAGLRQEPCGVPGGSAGAATSDRAGAAPEPTSGLDPVEAAGQELARGFMARAETVLYVLDASQPLHADDRAALAELDPRRTLLVLNKCDLAGCDLPGRALTDGVGPEAGGASGERAGGVAPQPGPSQPAQPQPVQPQQGSTQPGPSQQGSTQPGPAPAECRCSGQGGLPLCRVRTPAGGEVQDFAAARNFACLRVSAKTGAGLEALCAALRQRLAGAEPDPDALAPNARQAQALRQAHGELLALADEAQAGLPYDILGLRLDAACRSLSELVGEIAPDEVLEAIFSRFCIGK